MDVSNMGLLKLFTIIFFVVLSAGCFADTDVPHEDIIKFASLNVLKTFSAYEEKVQYCDQLASASPPKKLDMNKLEDINTTREDAILALGFFKFRNYFNCEKDIRMRLAFELGTLQSLKEHSQQDSKIVNEIQSMVAYPSLKEIELEVKYLALPKAAQDYFESTIGDSPFDLLQSLEHNGLMRE